MATNLREITTGHNAFNPADLAANAMLVHLYTGMPSMGRLDKRITDETNSEHRVESDMAGYRIKFYPKELLARVASVVSEAKQFHYRTSLPWAHAGPRIMPVANFLSHTEGFRRYKLEHHDCVEEVCDKYEHYKDVEAPNLLGDAYDPTDYPPVEVLRARFILDVKYFAIGDGKDFRKDISEEAALALREEVTRDLQAATADAMRDLWQRVAGVVGHMVERLTAYQPAHVDINGAKVKAQGTFNDSLVGNVRDLVDILPSMNIARDPNLDAIAMQMRKDLCVFDPAVLREDPVMRSAVAGNAAEILDRVNQFLA